MTIEEQAEAFELHLKQLGYEKRKNDWIPFETRDADEWEVREFGVAEMFGCPLPDDGDEIIVTNGLYVWIDVFKQDGQWCYLEDGDIEECTAWMPVPKPYVREKNDNTDQER